MGKTDWGGNWVLFWWAMLSKSLIQFSVDGWSCVPSLLFTWGQTMVVTGVHPTPGLLPGKSHGWRSLEGCSPWGRWGSDTTEWLHFHFSLSCIGEGNGNPLHCSCLENPRDREPGGRLSMGSHRVGHDWSDFAAVAVNYGGGNKDNGDLLQKIPCMYCYSQYPQPCSRPPLTHASPGDS